jgi:hypothetical protein
MAGLGEMFGASFATVSGKKPRNSDRIQEGQPLNLRGAFEAAQNIPVAGDVLSGVMAAYDAAKGDYPSAAMNAVGILPFVSGTFIGKGAKTWDAIKAADAEKRIAAGDDVRKVWKETGTFKGPDGHFRQEIDDSAANLTDGALKRFTPGTIQTFGDKHRGNVASTINHKGLQSGYPEWMRDIEIRESPKLEGGDFMSSQHFLDPNRQVGIINVSQSGENPKSTMLHELQHAIQSKEEWARGGSPDSIRPAELPEGQRKEYARAMDQYHSAKAEGDDKYANYFYRQADEILSAGSHDSYKRLAGEAEARATQARMNMNMEQRLNTYPLDSYDVPVDQLIIRGQSNGPALNATVNAPKGSIIDDYAGVHRPPMKDNGGAPLHDLTGGGSVYPDDIYSPQASQYYGHFGGNDPMDVATMRMIKSYRNNPDAPVTMYRAIPSNLPKDTPISNGDWVTINKNYAMDHGNGALNGDFQVIQKQVPARKLFTNGDSIHEYGYDESGRIKASLLGAMGVGATGAAVGATQLPDEYKSAIANAFR